MRLILVCDCGARTEIHRGKAIRCGRCGSAPNILWNGDGHVLGQGRILPDKEPAQRTLE